MEIKAKSRFDLETIRALAHISIYKKSNPKRKVTARLAISIIILMITIVISFVDDIEVITLYFIFLFVLIIGMDCFMYFGLPKIQYKALAKMKNAENEFIFYDNELKAFTKSESYNGEAKIEYSLFVKVYETSKYFFLYQTNNQAFIIDKATIVDGTVEEIRNKFSSFLKKKYIICKY